MIDLTIVVSSLPLVFKTQVGTSDDGVYNFEGWETGGLLGGFLIVRVEVEVGCSTLSFVGLFAEVPEGK
jgi:hypothetical protein